MAISFLNKLGDHIKTGWWLVYWKRCFLRGLGDLFDRLGDHINTVGQPVYEKRCFLRGLGDLFDRLGDHIKTGWATCLWEEIFFTRVGRPNLYNKVTWVVGWATCLIGWVTILKQVGQPVYEKKCFLQRLGDLIYTIGWLE